MAISEKPVEYRTSDGEVYLKKSDAERHEALVSAQSEYEDARRKLGILLAETQETADGHRFEFRAFRYYFVSRPFYGVPRIHPVSFDIWHFQFSNDDKFLVQQKDDDGQWRSYAIGELYRDERKAKKALAEALTEWLKERTEEVREIQESLLKEPF